MAQRNQPSDTFPNVFAINPALAAALHHLQLQTLPQEQLDKLAKQAAIIATRLQFDSNEARLAEGLALRNNEGVLQSVERRADEIRSATQSRSRGEDIGLLPDAFENMDALPDKVRNVLARYEHDDPSLDTAMSLERDLKDVGYLVSYGLGGEVSNLRPGTMTPSVAKQAVDQFMERYSHADSAIENHPASQTAKQSLVNYIDGCYATGTPVDTSMIEERAALCEAYFSEVARPAPVTKRQSEPELDNTSSPTPGL